MEVGEAGRAVSPSLSLTDPHEDHARRHVQAPHGPGDPAVHLGRPACLGPAEPEARPKT